MRKGKESEEQIDRKSERSNKLKYKKSTEEEEKKERKRERERERERERKREEERERGRGRKIINKRKSMKNQKFASILKKNKKEAIILYYQI